MSQLNNFFLLGFFFFLSLSYFFVSRTACRISSVFTGKKRSAPLSHIFFVLRRRENHRVAAAAAASSQKVREKDEEKIVFTATMCILSCE